MTENFRKEMERLSGVFPNECKDGVKTGEVYVIFDLARHPERYDISQDDIARVMYFDSHVDSCDTCTGVFKSRLDAEEVIAFYTKRKEPQPS